MHDEDINFDDTAGFVVEYGYRIVAQVTISARYVTIDYSADEIVSDIDGDHVGIYAYLTF